MWITNKTTFLDRKFESFRGAKTKSQSEKNELGKTSAGQNRFLQPKKGQKTANNDDGIRRVHDHMHQEWSLSGCRYSFSETTRVQPHENGSQQRSEHHEPVSVVVDVMQASPSSSDDLAAQQIRCSIKTNFMVETPHCIDGNTMPHTQAKQWMLFPDRSRVTPFLWQGSSTERSLHQQWRLIPSDYHTLNHVYCVQNVKSGKYLKGESEDNIPEMVDWSRQNAPSTKELLWRFERLIPRALSENMPIAPAHYSMICSATANVLQPNPLLADAIMMNETLTKFDLSHDCFLSHVGNGEYIILFSDLHGRLKELSAPETDLGGELLEEYGMSASLIPHHDADQSPVLSKWRLVHAVPNNTKLYHIVNVGLSRLGGDQDRNDDIMYLSGKIRDKTRVPQLTKTKDEHCIWSFLRATCSK